MKHVMKHWEIVIYTIAVCTILVTIIAIFFDRESITEYYNVKQGSVLEQREDTNKLSSLFAGNGTKKSPYLISTIDDIAKLRDVLVDNIDCEGIYFAQTDDIDVSNEGIWQPISPINGESFFMGEYDGQGHIITNLLLSHENTSFFGKVGGLIKNLGFENITINSDNCAVILNNVVEEHQLSVVNCYIKNVSISQEFFNVGLFANDFSRGTLIHCWSNSNMHFIIDTTMDYASVNYCFYMGDIYDLSRELLIYSENNSNIANITENRISESMNSSMDQIANYGVTGEFYGFQGDSLEKLKFSRQLITINNKENLTILYKFIRNLIIYAGLFALIFLISFVISRKNKINITKWVFYGSLSVCMILTIVYGAMTHGVSIIALLYDGRSDGQLKMFTDFFDCIRPGFTAYTDSQNGISTIYPPLVSVIFGLLNMFIPREELYSSIAARNSQMGTVMIGYVIALAAILFYKTIIKYKRGSKFEIGVFIMLIAFSYPVLHDLERGNVSIFCGMLITVFLFGYRSSSVSKRNIAYIALAVAAGIKIYPALLGILLFREKRTKEIFNCLSIGIIINLIPAIFLNTGFSSIAYMVINAKTMISNNSIIGGKVDLSRLIQIPQKISNSLVLDGIVEHYFLIWIILALLVLIVILYSRIEDWKIFSLAILGIILLSSFSPFYYYIYMLGPLIIFLDSNIRRKKRDILYALLFVGIFMTFASIHKYPLVAFIPEEGVWNMTVIAGCTSVVFFIVLLLEGIYDCLKRLIKCGRWNG
ncbi:glycosyltransferase family 87 protein [Murimonas intestini]|uniref:Uncharacterized protein DUF2029 n=1 Tax=Murimonas intestini TaxID=1337051 RepID=A0AB73SZ70_9FIRM|nr:glycosyltransferase family 87 protein [Murimonas intestini]MCR1842969.1 DUF2029 domain-containing protein [Murimonas intestini]MCR1864782.1 DUF2029 domain-containing protein [Murimonas intestini]MCR1885438.1 DUF2029 domain-containing protein [Murimonas intestini]